MKSGIFPHRNPLDRFFCLGFPISHFSNKTYLLRIFSDNSLNYHNALNFNPLHMLFTTFASL